MNDCAVIGGGAVGLSIAYEFSRHGLKPLVIERGLCGQEASWAGAGILPAAVFREGDTAYERLAGLSADLHMQWAEGLKSETGIDNGYHRCSEIFFEHEGISGDPLSRDLLQLQSRGIRVECLDASSLKQLEPHIFLDQGDQAGSPVYHTPDSAQIRNPRHLQALKVACQQRGVQIVEQAEVEDFEIRGERIVTVHTTAGSFSAEHFCLAAGAWTSQLAQNLRCTIPVKPIRGQMALLQCEEQLLRNVVHQGGHYLVPRLDGRVLVGSTLEDVGFEKKTTPSAIEQLLQFAQTRVPQLRSAEVESCWAGFRPGTPDGYPYIDAVPGFVNAWVAAGHYRWGLFLSPATAFLMRQLIQSENTIVQRDDFRIGRVAESVAQ